MSFWDYERNRRIVLENIERGDFSNVTEPKSFEERIQLMTEAHAELEEMRQKEGR